MAILIKWNILWLFFACVQIGKGSLGFLRAVMLTASHKDVDRALGQPANAVVTALTCIGSLWLSKAVLREG